MEKVFDATDYEPGERYRRFQEIVADYTGVFDFIADDASQLNAHVLGSMRDCYAFNKFASIGRPLSVLRPRTLIRPEDEGFYWVSAVTAGQWVVHGEDSDAVLTRGDVVIFDPAAPTFVKYVPEAADGESAIVNVTMPKHMFTASSGILPLRFPVFVTRRNPMSTILWGLVVHLCNEASSLPFENIGPVMDRLSDIVCESVIDNFKYRDQYQTYEATHLWIAKAVLERRLDAPGLSLEEIAHQINKSPEYLASVFEKDGLSFQDWIAQRRLERARAEIERADRLSASITEIASRWGFQDVAELDRSLRQRFGVDVAELRNTARYAAARQQAAQGLLAQRA